VVNRQQYIGNGQKIYEWDQTVDEINVYIQPPPNTSAKHLSISIQSTQLTVGLKGNPPFLQNELWSRVKTSSSFWTLEDGMIHITLDKLTKAETWAAVIKGHEQLDPLQFEKEQQNIMLQRFQTEHPGFDFSGASFSGACPDPTSFLGGMKTTN